MLETERDELAAAARDGERRAGRRSDRSDRGGAAQDPGMAAADGLLGPGRVRAVTQLPGRPRGDEAGAGTPLRRNLHEWRKRAKDLWYQLRILRDAWPRLLGVTVDQAHELTELLGDHHDLAVLAEDLRGREDLGDRDAFESAIEEHQRELLDAALEHRRRLYAEKPKAFGRRIARYWLAWREA